MDFKKEDKKSQKDELLEKYDVPKYRRGDIVSGKVIRVDANCIYLDLGSITEGKIYLDKFTKNKDTESFFDVGVKIGDEIEAEVQQVTTEEPIQLLLSRLNMIDKLKVDELKDAFNKKQLIKATIITVNDGGLVLDYYNNEIFIPRSLLDNEIFDDAPNLIGKELELYIEEIKEKQGRRRRGQSNLQIIGSRKPIFEAKIQKLYEERQKLREEELENIKTGDIVKGHVLKIDVHAVTVKFKHVTGLLRISQVAHYRIEDLNDHFKIGDEVEVKVIKKEGNRLDLSMKALVPTPYNEFVSKHEVGDDIKGIVSQKLISGLIIEVAPNVRGFLYKNEFSWNPNEKYDSGVSIGDEIDVKIIKITPERERISLSRKLLYDNPWKHIRLRRGDIVDATIKEFRENDVLFETNGVEATMDNNEFGLKSGRPEDYHAVGDKLEVVVLRCDLRGWILELSLRQLKELVAQKEVDKYLEEQEEEQEEGLTVGHLLKKELKKQDK